MAVQALFPASRVIASLCQCALVFWAATVNVLLLNDNRMLLVLAVLEWTGSVLERGTLCSWLPYTAPLTFGMLVALGAPCAASTLLFASILSPKLNPLLVRLLFTPSTLTPRHILGTPQAWPALAAIVGAFAGAWFLPLDWGAAWQKWPGPVVLVSQIAHTLFLLPCVCMKMRKGPKRENVLSAVVNANANANVKNKNKSKSKNNTPTRNKTTIHTKNKTNAHAKSSIASHITNRFK